ncbi:MAG: ABC transporter ATP-binding protein [Candidatus Caldarchaeum sp.]|nr:ABC transporter ATP-binding protein [Candidatus Caldarchaeum sp.]
MKPVLRAENIVTGYGDNIIINDVSLSVNEQEIVSVLGPNGAGKSTLLKSIASVIPKRGGRVYFFDEDVTNMSTKELISRGLVYIMQGRNVFPFMTVYENLELSGLMLGNKKLFRERLEKVYEMFPVLREKKAKKAHTLSGGEQRMLELARAFIYQPKLLLLDEPSIGLSPKIVEDLYRKIVSTVRSEGISLLLVEQNVSKAVEVSDRIYLLDLGEVKFSGTKEEMLASKSLLTAYLGI